MSCQYEKTVKSHENACPVLGFQDVMVGVPIEIKPFAQVGRIETDCVGNPIIKKGTIDCQERPEQSCKFIVSQKIRVEIPIIFGAKTKVSEAIIDCKHCDIGKSSESKQLSSAYNINE